MKKGKKLWNRLLATTLAVSLAGGMLSGAGAKTVRAEEDENEAGRLAYEKIMGDKEPADFKVDKDPFGYGKGEDFMLYTQNELFVLQGESLDDKSVKSYGKLKAENSDDSPFETQNDGKVKDYTDKYKNDISYAQSVSFDPNRSLRNDHIAIAGIYGGDNKIYVKILDKNGKLVKELCLGEASWMTHSADQNNDDMWDFNAMNFISITAGDYDNDGFDSVIVYACLDNNDYGLFEIYDEKQYDAATDTYTSKGFKVRSSTATKDLLHDEYPDIYEAHLDQGGKNIYVGNKLHCDIDSGDINGDGIDDLVVLSYVNRTTGGSIAFPHEYMRDKVTELYRPYLAVKYGEDGFTGNITADVDKGIGVWKQTNAGEDETPLFVAPAAAGLSVGDVDGDGAAEPVVAGFKRVIEGEEGEEVDDCLDELDKSYLVAAVYESAKNNLVCQAFDYSQKTNNWTKGDATKGGLFVGPAGGSTEMDNSWQRTAVETVAFDGIGAAEHIFISGDIYTYDAESASITIANNPEYFKHTDTGFQDVVAEETYIRSTAVGVFDGNLKGREQIVYVIGCADQNNVGDTIYTEGMIGGIYRDNQDNPTERAMDFYCTTETQVASSYYPDRNGGSCEYNDYMNYEICAWDNNSDGMHARYSDKGYVYSDPEVMAVLQAPPYFDEMDGTTSGAETEYSLTTSYSYDTSESNNVSWGVAYELEAESDPVKFDFSIGVENDWSETFTASLTTSDEYTFKAIGDDQVVIYRTPITIYRYQVETDGEFDDDHFTDFSFPGVPSKEIISVDTYNAFVDYYNEMNEKKAEEVNKTLPDAEKIKDDQIPRLEKIEDEWLGNAGNPFGYMQADSGAEKTILQKTPNAFTTGSSATGYSWSKENSSSHEKSHAHGFNFDLTLLFGGGALGNHVHMGVTTSLQFTHEFSTCETNADGVGTSCEIGNMDEALLAAAGISNATAGTYGFNYQMVSWPSGLKKDIKVPDDPKYPDQTHIETVDIPIYGYMLSDVRAGAKPVDDLTAEFSAEDGEREITLKWTKPDRDSDPVGGYVLYEVLKDGSLNKIDVIEGSETSYVYKDLDWRSEYSFVLKSIGTFSGVEGVNSNTAIVYSDSSGVFSIELKSSEEDKDIFVVKHLNGKTSEFEVAHKKAAEIISMEKISEDGDVETFKLTYDDGTTKNITVKGAKKPEQQVIVQTVVAEQTPPAPGDTVKVALSKAKYVVKDTKEGEDPQVEYTGYTDTEIKSITIPDTVKVKGVTYKVTAVKDDAFKGYKKLKKVTIGGNVTKIGKNAFADCPELTTIVIESNVKSIGDNAFSNTKKLKKIIVKTKKLTNKSVAKDAFKGIGKKVIFQVPKGKKKAYRTLFRKKGLSKKNKFK